MSAGDQYCQGFCATPCRVLGRVMESLGPSWPTKRYLTEMQGPERSVLSTSLVSFLYVRFQYHSMS